MNKYPDNVQSAFTNYIEPPMILAPGEWTVGITEIFHNQVVPSYIKKLSSCQVNEIDCSHEQRTIESLIGPQQVEMMAAHEFLYIHTDIIADRIVGDQQVKCLKVTPTRINKEEIIRFGRVEYIPVEVSHIRNISIQISDEQGQRIDFSDNLLPTMITLHFKKK